MNLCDYWMEEKAMLTLAEEKQVERTSYTNALLAAHKATLRLLVNSAGRGDEVFA